MGVWPFISLVAGFQHAHVFQPCRSGRLGVRHFSCHSAAKLEPFSLSNLTQFRSALGRGIWKTSLNPCSAMPRLYEQPKVVCKHFWCAPPSLARAGRAASMHIVPSNVLAMEGAKKRVFMVHPCDQEGFYASPVVPQAFMRLLRSLPLKSFLHW